jgi:hypothetical protein
MEYNRTLRICTFARPTQQSSNRLVKLSMDGFNQHIGQAQQTIIEGLDGARSPPTSFNRRATFTKHILSVNETKAKTKGYHKLEGIQASSRKSERQASRKKGSRARTEMTMEDRRAEAIRQVHEQEVMMQRNTAAVRQERGRAIKLGYQVSPWIAREASSMVSFSSNPLALSLLEVRLYGPVSVTTRSRINETWATVFRGS